MQFGDNNQTERPAHGVQSIRSDGPHWSRMSNTWFLSVDADFLFLAICQNQRMENESAKIKVRVGNICADAIRVQVCHAGRRIEAGQAACMVK
jgi:hypothetical protein